MTGLHRFWSAMTSKEFARLAKAEVIAVLPVGAIEQHGPHLPLAVDTCILEGIINHALALLPDDDDLAVTILPTQAIGKSNEHSRYPGTLTFSAETLIRSWMEIGDCIAAAGIRKLVLFNSHGGQLSIMDIVARDLRIKHAMLVISSSWFSLGLPAEITDSHEIQHGIHGGMIETAMMLHLAPDRVDMTQAENFHSLTEQLVNDYPQVSLSPGGKLAWQIQDLNPQGACGNAAAATRPMGERLVDHAARRFLELLRDVDRLPLDVLTNKPAW